VGQGAKDIGGESRSGTLRKARTLKERGYICSGPADPDVTRASSGGPSRSRETFTVGMVTEESFARKVEELRRAGAKYIFLKTGAYRPADLSRALMYSTRYKLDL